MSTKNLSKLQIRAEVLSILQELTTASDVRSINDKVFEKFREITDRASVLNVLLSEFVKADEFKADVIALLIVELAELKDVSEVLWSYIKDPSCSDKLKEVAINILRVLGEKLDVDVLTTYLENPEEIIDKETQKLLEVAIIDPEAQIDFLDFLFALGDDGKLQLLESLSSDYKGNELANIVTPALFFQSDFKIKKLIIDILGQSKSALAVAPLKDVIEYFNDEKLVKLAKKSLNLLKLSGVNVLESAEKKVEICDISEAYDCYSSIIDGSGNQGIIFSRIDSRNLIYLFCTVINDLEGIIDCFGFSTITKEEFERIVERFKTGSSAVKISCEYCKFLLNKAELLNKKQNKSIPYEYSAWSSLLWNIRENNEELLLKCTKRSNNFTYMDICAINEFNTWFWNENHDDNVKTFLNNIDELITQKPCTSITGELIDEQIKEFLDRYFEKNLLSIYKVRLQNFAYLQSLNGEMLKKDIACSIFEQLESKAVPSDNIFLQIMARKSIFEYYLRKKEEIEVQKTQKQNVFLMKKEAKTRSNKLNLSLEDLDVIIKFLQDMWTEN